MSTYTYKKVKSSLLKNSILKRVCAPLLLTLTALTLSFTSVAQSQSPARVAAAADLQLALKEVQELFHQQSEHRVQVTYGSSGVFTTQLRQGAPFELFFSAQANYVEILYDDGLTLDQGTDYARGRIAFFSRDPLDATDAESALRAWLDNTDKSSRLSIANPSHAPYGVAAMSWLQTLSLEEPLRGRMVLGENAAQAVQFALSGAARTGIVAWPLLKSRDLPGQAWLIPETAHIPLRQRMVLMNNAGPAAKAFYQFLQEQPALDILSTHGFGSP